MRKSRERCFQTLRVIEVIDSMKKKSTEQEQYIFKIDLMKGQTFCLEKLLEFYIVFYIYIVSSTHYTLSAQTM